MAEPRPRPGPYRAGAVSGRWAIVLTVFFVLLTLLLLYAIVALWPQPAIENAVGSDPVNPAPAFFGTPVPMTRDQNFFVMVALLGAFGAMGHVLRSFFMYVGERRLVWSWVASYLVIPAIGAVLAMIAYVLLRAGLLGGAAPEGNTWGFAAVAALVGLFNGQAASKLKDVFEVVFAPAKQGSDKLRETAGPTIDEISPASGKPGDTVTISGSGLAEVTEVVFGGDVPSKASWDPSTGTLTTTVPEGAQNGHVSVTVGDATATSADEFEVAEA